MDVLANVIAATRIGNAILCGAEFRPPWGIRFDTENRAHFHIISRGNCWLRLNEDAKPLQLFQGDVVLAPFGGGHILSDSPDTPALPMAEALENCSRSLHCRTSDETLSGTGASSTALICGGYSFDHQERNPLLSLLPPIIHIPADRMEEGGGLQTVFRLLRNEVYEKSSGAETVISRLVDVLFVYVLRYWVANEPTTSASWLTALEDPQIGKTLALMHENPGKPWTVDSLASESLMSRAVFAKRFSALVGEPPHSYLTRWRIGIAARSIRESGKSLSEISREIGYESEFSFSKAFRRIMGLPPGEYRTREKMRQQNSEDLIPTH